MLGINFYLDYPNKTEKHKGTRKDPGNHSGNVVAVMTRYERGKWSNFPDWISYGSGPIAAAIGALLFVPNSPVCSTSVSMGYLDDRCKRISEKMAREIHPMLFTYLDQS